jgi:uncharacterized RDD family membrane protein YckC
MLHAATSTTTRATRRAHPVARRVHGAEPTAPPDTRYVGLVTRAIAFAADALIINGVAVVVAAVVALVFSILPSAHVPKGVSVAIGAGAFVLWLVGYFATFWTTTGQTPGNRMLGIKVVRRDGSRFRPRHAIVRLVGMIASAPLLLGYLPILVTEERRGLHDWLAGTVVIAAAESESA